MKKLDLYEVLASDKRQKEGKDSKDDNFEYKFYKF